MKKVIFAITMLCIVATSVFVACKKDATINNKNNSIERNNKGLLKEVSGLALYLDRVDSIGILHNQSMDFLYDIVVNMKANNWKGNPNQFDSIVKAKTIEFYATKGIDLSSQINLSIGQEYVPQEFSTSTKAVLNAVYSAVDNYGDGLISHAQLIDVLVAQKIASYQIEDSNESYIAGVVSSVAQFSMTYWKDNASKYDILIGGTNPPEPCYMSDNQRKVGKADIKGAAWGLLEGPFGAMFGGTTSSFIKAIEIVRNYDCWWCP